jgi:hypothetical protein
MLLRVMVVILAHNWDLVGLDLKSWIDAVMLKLIDVGVVSLMNFIVGVLDLILRFERAGHRRFHGSTLQAMMAEAGEMVFRGEAVGPESEVESEKSLTISILSLLHRAKVLTTKIGLPCHKMLHFMRSRCIPGDGAAAPLGEMPAKCLVGVGIRVDSFLHELLDSPGSGPPFFS